MLRTAFQTNQVPQEETEIIQGHPLIATRMSTDCNTCTSFKLD